MFNNKEGVTLLIAIVVISSGLAIALGISSLVLGQIKISQSIRASHVAVYSANAALECAEYYHWRGSIQGPSISYWRAEPGGQCDGEAPANCVITCFGRNIPVTYSNPGSEHVYTFSLQISPPDPPPPAGNWSEQSAGICANVKIVTEHFTCATPDAEYDRTIIKADGYSSCPASGVNRTLLFVDRPDLPTERCPDDLDADLDNI